MAEARTVLLSEAEVAQRVDSVAKLVAATIDDEAVAVCLLTGGLWFAADLTRALAKLGVDPAFDAIWLTSYGDERESSGRVTVRAGLQRPVDGRAVLLIDDVLDSGLSLAAAAEFVTDAGAAKVLTCVFAEKPWPTPRALKPDFVAWHAPARFLVGYGMDDSGRRRGLPAIEAVD